MADVKIVDIDNEQWNMKDQEARTKIAVLENNQTPTTLEDVSITINSGYTASQARFYRHYKIGKIHFAMLQMENISGNNIGTTATADFGTTPFRPVEITCFLVFDYINEKVARCIINKNGDFAIGESNGMVQGNNYSYGEAIWVESE